MGEALITRALPAHGGQLSAISATFSLPMNRLLDFSASIYPDGPSPRVTEALSDALRSPQLHAYRGARQRGNQRLIHALASVLNRSI